MVAVLGKSARLHIVRLMTQPTKRSKKNDDKSAVALLKKDDWHGRGPVTDQISRSIKGNLIRGVMKSWDKSHRNVSYLMHDNWVAYFRT